MFIGAWMLVQNLPLLEVALVALGVVLQGIETVLTLHDPLEAVIASRTRSV